MHSGIDPSTIPFISNRQFSASLTGAEERKALDITGCDTLISPLNLWDEMWTSSFRSTTYSSVRLANWAGSL